MGVVTDLVALRLVADAGKIWLQGRDPIILWDLQPIASVSDRRKQGSMRQQMERGAR